MLMKTTTQSSILRRSVARSPGGPLGFQQRVGALLSSGAAGEALVVFAACTRVRRRFERLMAPVTAAAVAAAAAGRPQGGAVQAPSWRVTFHVHYRANLGDHLAVVGSDVLGNWQVPQQVKLTWHEGDDWSGDVEAPAGATLEYKYIVVRRGGAVEWSPGHNYKLELPHCEAPGGTVEVREGWAHQGPRTVSITEPDPAGGGTPPGPAAADVAAGGGASNEAEAAWEAAVVGLLAQYPLMPADRIHRAVQVLKPKRPDMALEQLQALLARMVKEEVLVDLGGRYRLHAAHRYAPAGGKRAPAPVPAAGASPTAASGGAAAAAAGPGGEGVSEALLVPAVMRLLEAYASMSLDRMLRALSQAAPGNEVQGVTERQLAQVLTTLQQEGKVLLGGDGQFRKGAAAAAASRRAATPSASRRPQGYGSPSPGPSAAALHGHPHPRAPPATSSSSSASGVAALPSQAPGTTMTLEQLAAFEQRALALLSNYAACTAERVHAQLRGTSDFPGTVQDTVRLLHALSLEGRVREADGIYTYQAHRQPTPVGARGPSPAARARSPPGAPHAPRHLHAHAAATAAAPAPPSSSAVVMRFSPSLSRGVGGADAGVGGRAAEGGGGGANRKMSAHASSAAAGHQQPSLEELGMVRRSLSAYSMFCQERRETLRSALPLASASELTRALATEWQAAPAGTRQRYERAAQTDRRRYEADLRRRDYHLGR